MTTNNLTELWKKGELEAGWYYVLLFSNEEYITFIDGNWVVDDRLVGADIKEVIAPVPSFEEWQPFTDPYFRGLTTKDIAELAKKSIRLTTQHCEDNERIEKLEELLKECREYVVNTPVYPQGDDDKQDEIHILVDKIDEALK